MINIFYCTDDKFFKQQLVSLISLKNTTKEELNVINLNVECKKLNKHSKKMTDEQTAFLDGLLKTVNKNSSFRSIDVSNLFEEVMVKGPNLNWKFYSYFVTIRLIADLVKEIPDKVLYVDADVIFNKDVKELFDIDIEKVEIAGRRDKGRIFNYMQSGVMLMNMALIRKTGLLERARKLVTTKKYLYIDMTPMNIACKKRLILPKKYNNYKYNENNIIHHVCDTRVGKIPLTKNGGAVLKLMKKN